MCRDIEGWCSQCGRALTGRLVPCIERHLAFSGCTLGEQGLTPRTPRTIVITPSTRPALTAVSACNAAALFPHEPPGSKHVSLISLLYQHSWSGNAKHSSLLVRYFTAAHHRPRDGIWKEVQAEVDKPISEAVDCPPSLPGSPRQTA